MEALEKHSVRTCAWHSDNFDIPVTGLVVAFGDGGGGVAVSRHPPLTHFSYGIPTYARTGRAVGPDTGVVSAAKTEKQEVRKTGSADDVASTRRDNKGERRLSRELGTARERVCPERATAGALRQVRRTPDRVALTGKPFRDLLFGLLSLPDV